MKLRNNVLGFISHEGTGFQFFEDVIPNTKEILKEKKCILTADEEWVVPKSVFLKDQFGIIDDVVSASDIRKYLPESFLINSEFKVTSKLLIELGCTKFEFSDLVSLLNTDEFWDDRDIEWYSKLYAIISDLYNQEKISNRELRELRYKLKIPLEGNKFIRLSESPYIFLELSSKRYGFEHNLLIVSHSFVSKFRDDRHFKFHKMLDVLEVGEGSPENIIKLYLIKYYKEKLFNEIDAAESCGHIKYLKDNYEFISKDLFKEIKEVLLVKTKNPENHYALPSQLLISSDLNQIKLEEYLPESYSKNFVSIDGLDVNLENKDEVTAWSKFFSYFGASSIPTLNSKIFNYFVSSLSDSIKEWFISKVLHNNWKYYSRSIENGNLNILERIKSIEVLTSNGEYTRLSETYLINSDIQQIFGNDVPFLQYELTNSSFINDVGIIPNLSFESAIQRLENLSNEEKNVEAEKVARIYMWLQANWHHGGTNPAEHFRNKKLIFLPTTNKWVTSFNSFFKSPPEMKEVEDSLSFGSVRKYSSLEQFFVKQLEISESPSPQQWLAILSKYLEKTELRKCNKHLISLYRKIDNFIEDGSWSSSWDQEVSFVNRNYQPWEHDGDLLAVDDEELYEYFRDHPSFSYFLPDASNLPFLSSFLEHFKIRKLSDEVSYNLSENEDGKHAPEINSVINKRWLHIARVIWSAGPDFRHVYKEIRDNGSLIELQKTRVLLVNELRILVKLGQDSSIEINEDVITDIYECEPTILLDCSKEERWQPYIADEICKNLGCRSLSDLVRIILEARTEEDIESEFKRKKSPSLPEEELSLLKGEVLIEDSENDDEQIEPAQPESSSLIVQEDSQGSEDMPAISEVHPELAQQADEFSLDEENEDSIADATNQSRQISVQQETSDSPEEEIGEDVESDGFSRDDQKEKDVEKSDGVKGNSSGSSEAFQVSNEQNEDSIADVSTSSERNYIRNGKGENSEKNMDQDSNEDLLDDLLDALEPFVQRGKLTDEQADKILNEIAPPISPDIDANREIVDQTESGEFDESRDDHDIVRANRPPPSTTSWWKNRKKRRKRPGKRKDFVSYVHVNPSNRDSRESPEEILKRIKIDQKAVEFVMKNLEQNNKEGYEIIKMPHENPGYDIKLLNAQKNKETYIEVKGTAGPWSKGVAMTWKQFLHSQKNKGRSYLFVVENVLGKKPKLFKISDPAHLAQRFVFDDGWRNFANGQNKDSNNKKKELRELEGKKIRWGNEGAEILKIEEVKESSKLKVHISTQGGLHTKSYISLKMLKRDIYNG